MGAGKILCIIGGIVALVATILFSFYSFEILTVTYTGYGIGIFINLMDIFEAGDVIAIILTIVYIVSVISGVFILIGVKVRALAIIGAIFALFLAVLLILIPGFELDLGDDLGLSLLFFLADPLVEGIIPFDIPLGFGSISLGSILLAGGGVLGLIGGIMGPEGF
ncbi:MAG: hypothetical protein ACFE9I_04665 [Candidatus Hermodarchaeota archaeon]